MRMENWFLIIALLSLFSCNSKQDVQCNMDVDITGFIVYDALTYKVTLKKNPRTNHVELAREKSHYSTVYFYDSLMNVFIRVYSNPNGFFGDYTYPKVYPDSSEILWDYFGREFHEFGGGYYYAHISDSLKAYVAFVNPDSLWKRKIDSSYKVNFLKGLLIEKLTNRQRNNTHFVVPHISTGSDSFESFYWDQPAQLSNPAIFKGIFRFGENVHLVPNTKKLFKSYKSSSYYTEKRDDGFLLFDRFTNNVGIWVDSLSEGRFYYPLFIVNETSRVLEIPISRDGVVIIQEIELHQGDWESIEQAPRIFNDRIDLLVIPPSSFALFLLPKYTGDYTTDIRARVFIGGNTFLSMEHHVQINTKLIE